jgi:hypothetical protein
MQPSARLLRQIAGDDKLEGPAHTRFFCLRPAMQDRYTSGLSSIMWRIRIRKWKTNECYSVIPDWPINLQEG